MARPLEAAGGCGGKRLELVSGRPAVLVARDSRLRLGKRPVPLEELERRLEGALPRPLWVVLELGKEAQTRLEVGGGAMRLAAEEGPPPWPTSPPARFEAEAGPAVALERPLDRMLARGVELGAATCT